MSSERDLDALAGEYVLGLADPEDAARIERDLPNDPALAEAVAAWRRRFSPLDHVADRLEPSSSLWSRIEQGVTGAPAPRQAAKWPVRARSRNSIWNDLNFWRAAGLMGTFASLVLATGLGLTGKPGPKPAVVAVLESADSSPGAIVEAFADGSIRLRPLTTIDVPTGKTLQVWTLWDRGVGPVPLGLLQQAQEARLTRAGQPVPRSKQLYEITLEPEGGSPTGRPTGPILYKGLAATPL